MNRAVCNGTTYLADYLLSEGIDLEILNNNAETALGLAPNHQDRASLLNMLLKILGIK